MASCAEDHTCAPDRGISRTSLMSSQHNVNEEQEGQDKEAKVSSLGPHAQQIQNKKGSCEDNAGEGTMVSRRRENSNEENSKQQLQCTSTISSQWPPCSPSTITDDTQLPRNDPLPPIPPGSDESKSHVSTVEGSPFSGSNDSMAGSVSSTVGQASSTEGHQSRRQKVRALERRYRDVVVDLEIIRRVSQQKMEEKSSLVQELRGKGDIAVLAYEDKEKWSDKPSADGPSKDVPSGTIHDNGPVATVALDTRQTMGHQFVKWFGQDHHYPDTHTGEQATHAETQQQNSSADLLRAAMSNLKMSRSQGPFEGQDWQLVGDNTRPNMAPHILQPILQQQTMPVQGRWSQSNQWPRTRYGGYYQQRLAPSTMSYGPVHQQPGENRNLAYHRQSIPIHHQATPMHPQSTPIHLQTTPIHPQSTPIHPQATPIHPQSAPIHPQSTPQSVLQSHIGYSYPKPSPLQPSRLGNFSMFSAVRGPAQPLPPPAADSRFVSLPPISPRATVLQHPVEAAGHSRHYDDRRYDAIHYTITNAAQTVSRQSEATHKKKTNKGSKRKASKKKT